MEEIRAQINEVIIEFLEEVYDGPNHPYTWFITTAPNTGLLGTINEMNAEEASTPIIKKGTTIAAHVEHLRWSLNMANSSIRGENPAMNWSESWRGRHVNSGEWELLVQELRREFNLLIQTLSSGMRWASDEQLSEVLALIPRAAYHLGAIRQMASIVKA